MDPAVMPGQDLGQVAGPVRTVRWQIWQRVTGSWVRSPGSGGEVTCSSGTMTQVAGVIRAMLTPHVRHAA